MRSTSLAHNISFIRSLVAISSVLLLLQGCSLQSWVTDRYEDFTDRYEDFMEPEEIRDPAEKFRDYDKKLTGLLGVGRCVMNTRDGIEEFIEFSSPDLKGLSKDYRALGKRQAALKNDRDRIRAIINSTTVDPNNLLEPYSHITQFSGAWYDSISERDWKAIDGRYQGHISFLEKFATHSSDRYNQAMMDSPSADRGVLMKPIYCVSAIPLLTEGTRIDKPGYFDLDDGNNDSEEEVSITKPSTWFGAIVTGPAFGPALDHVALVNEIGSYRDECNCYVESQKNYTAAGARFFVQSKKYGDGLCSSANDPSLAEIENDLKDFISELNIEQQTMDESLDSKIFSKVVEPFVERENDPMNQHSGAEILRRVERHSAAFYDIASVQYAHSRRAREESTINNARKTLICLHDTRGKSSGNLYLQSDYIKPEVGE